MEAPTQGLIASSDDAKSTKAGPRPFSRSNFGQARRARTN